MINNFWFNLYIAFAISFVIWTCFFHRSKERPVPRREIKWRCDICREWRPDDKIDVYKRDVSHEYKMPAGGVFEHIKYCNDRPTCWLKVPDFSHMKRKDIKP